MAKLPDKHAANSAGFYHVRLVYDRNHYFGFGPIPKPKPKSVDTFGQYRNGYQNRFGIFVQCFKIWFSLVTGFGHWFSYTPGHQPPSALSATTLWGDAVHFCQLEIDHVTQQPKEPCQSTCGGA